MSPYQIIFGKAYNLPMELECKAYWAVKQCNIAYDQAREQRKFQFQELDELRLEAFENARIYKQKVKKFHDHKILRKDFHVGQKVLLFNSRLKLTAVQLKDEHTNSTFQVNGHQIKPFHLPRSSPSRLCIDLIRAEVTLAQQSHRSHISYEPQAKQSLPERILSLVHPLGPKLTILSHSSLQVEARKTIISPHPWEAEEPWNCLGSESESSVGEA
ncbi:hypothetical protein CR513_41907, partial [Mucuna pruriens]